VVTDGLVTPPAPATELIDAAHRRLLREDWELAICLTDMPLRIGRHPVAGHASPTHRVALISVPALGPTRLRRRALETALDLVDGVIGEVTGDEDGEPRSQGERFSDSAVEHLAEEGFDPQFGARPLRRAIQRLVETRLSRMVLAGELNPGDRVAIDFQGGELLFDVEPGEGQTEEQADGRVRETA
jgi:hypothetical protein